MNTNRLASVEPGRALGAVPSAARVGIVSVTYNSASLIDGCLTSLARQNVDLRTVVVVDNASRDDTVAVAGAAAAPVPVRVVQTGRNAGYAAAVNAGIDSLDLDDLDAVFVVNPDCRLGPDTLRILVETLHTRPACGIAVPKLLNEDGTLQPSLRNVPTVRRALGEAALGKRASKYPTWSELRTEPADYTRPSEAGWATGAAMLLSTAMIKDIGPWDESFFLFSEETEYCLRARDRGWRTWYEPAAVIEHIGGEGNRNPLLAALSIVNKVALFRRRHSASAAAAFYAITVLGEGVRALAGRRSSQAGFSALVRRSHRPARRFGSLDNWSQAV